MDKKHTTFLTLTFLTISPAPVLLVLVRNWIMKFTYNTKIDILILNHNITGTLTSYILYMCSAQKFQLT